jgi:hypothetical protein
MAATPSLRLVFADQGFAGRFVDWCDSVLGLAVEIVRPPAGQHR